MMKCRFLQTCTGGNLFILFAPHVGVTGDGSLGKYARIGATFTLVSFKPIYDAISLCKIQGKAITTRPAGRPSARSSFASP